MVSELVVRVYAQYVADFLILMSCGEIIRVLLKGEFLFHQS